MKLIRYKRDNASSAGILTEKGIIDIPSVWEGPNPPRNTLEVLQKGEGGFAKLKKLVQTSEIVIPADEVCVRRSRFLSVIGRSVYLDLTG